MDKKIKQVDLLIDHLEISVLKVETGNIYVICEAFWPITSDQRFKLGTFMLYKDQAYWKNLDDPEHDYLVNMMISEELFYNYFDENGYAYDHVQLIKRSDGLVTYAIFGDEYHRVKDTLYEGVNFVILYTDKGLAVGYSATDYFISDYDN